MATETLTLKDDTPTSYTYVLTSLNGNEAVYRDNSSSLQNPRLMRISHQITSKDDGSDRHLVQLSRSDDNADGDPFLGSVHVVLSLPREGVTSADLVLEWEKLKNCVDVAITELLDGFMPSAGSV